MGQSPGTFWCCSSTAPDPSFSRFGLAICLYMKFVKHINCVYLLLALLAITSCAVCVAVAVDNNFDPLLDYQTFFYSTSLGAFSSKYMKCDYSTISSNQASLAMSCPSGKVNGSIVTGVVPAVMTN